MAFYPKERNEFLKSLKDIEINRSLVENLIESFTPDGLSNMYELFTKLKDIKLSSSQFKILTSKISSHYSQNIVDLLNNPITSSEINQLLEIMKQDYLEVITSNNPKNISDEEQERLKIIINKHFPSLFLSFIKTPISPEEFSRQQQLIKETVIKLSDMYYKQTTSHGQQNSDYVGSGIYLIYRKLYPELSITLPKREKGAKSFIDNTQKELNKNIKNMIPNNIETGITFSDMEKHIVSTPENPNNFTDKTNADLSGITVVLNYVDDAIYFDESEPENTEIIKLKKQKNDNLRFIHSVKHYLNEYDFVMTQEEYFQIYIELLHRLQDSTYPECTHEIREGSYSSRLEYAIANYKKNAETNSFALNATDDEVAELRHLTDCLKKRLYDKLENEILSITFPHVLADPLFTDDFKMTCKFVKFTKKENGFCAIYYELTDAFGRKIEVQLQSNMRYKETLNGLSSHNDMPNKKVDIKPFFELVGNKNDPELLNSYLSLLGRTSRSQEESLRQKLEKLEEAKNSRTKSPEEKRQVDNSIRRLRKKIEAIETARNNIKIKDEFIEEHEMIDTENTQNENNYGIKYVDGKPIKVYDTKTAKRISKISIEQYLLTYAEYISPVSMKVISSAHATSPEAYINKKTLVESFSEILRKGGEITYLSELLIDKLKEILNIKDRNQLSLEDLREYAQDSQNGFYASEGNWKNISDTSAKIEGKRPQQSER